MIDTHAHLNDDRLASRFDEITGGFECHGLDAVVNIGADLPSSVLAAKQSGGNVYCALGVHPEGAARTTEADYLTLERLIRTTPACIAVGEVGLDFHYPEPSAAVQEACFERQIELADSLGKPLILHVRDAYGEVLRILRGHVGHLHGGIVHCYSGSAESAKIFVELGYSIAFGGAITFKNNTHAAAVIRSVPLDKLLCETDCPYLAPVPHRGEVNEPRYVRFVLEKMSEFLGLSLSEVERITTRNFYRTFGLKESFENGETQTPKI